MYRTTTDGNTLYIPGLKIFDTVTDTATADIPINSYQRDPVKIGNKLYLLSGSIVNQLTIIDLSTNNIISNTTVSPGPYQNNLHYGNTGS
jgi:hypothetical protein